MMRKTHYDAFYPHIRSASAPFRIRFRILTLLWQTCFTITSLISASILEEISFLKEIW
jgi:hypothetical protein